MSIRQPSVAGAESYICRMIGLMYTVMNNSQSQYIENKACVAHKPSFHGQLLSRYDSLRVYECNTDEIGSVNYLARSQQYHFLLYAYDFSVQNIVDILRSNTKPCISHCGNTFLISLCRKSRTTF